MWKNWQPKEVSTEGFLPCRKIFIKIGCYLWKNCLFFPCILIQNWKAKNPDWVSDALCVHYKSLSKGRICRWLLIGKMWLWGKESLESKKQLIILSTTKRYSISSCHSSDLHYLVIHMMTPIDLHVLSRVWINQESRLCFNWAGRWHSTRR
jgi:hypothetical protein